MINEQIGKKMADALNDIESAQRLMDGIISMEVTPHAVVQLIGAGLSLIQVTEYLLERIERLEKMDLVRASDFNQ